MRFREGGERDRLRDWGSGAGLDAGLDLEIVREMVREMVRGDCERSARG